MKNESFIHLFRCSTGFYLYDVNTDVILKIKEDTYNILNNCNQEENEQIKTLKREGYLRNDCVQITEHPMTKYLPEIYKNDLKAMILQVTQNCNLRCEYCVYSGKYNTRTHTNKRMNFEMAKRGIDYLVAHSSESAGLTLGFYGGEPLLEFGLIKQCVEYIKNIAKDKNVLFAITTNATLLTEEVVDYFVENEFEITVSFDGPKEIHDSHRRFANNDKGTYDIVMKNVRYIKDNFYDYFKNSVSFNTVLNPSNGYRCIGDYINGDDVLSDSFFTASVINEVGLKKEEKIDMTETFFEEYSYEYFKLLMSKVGRFNRENVSKVVEGDFRQISIMRGGRQRCKAEKLPEKFHHGGPCIPGKRAIFLTVDGNFYPCEKVCEDIEDARFGDVWQGVDLQKASWILNIEKHTELECKKCWAYRYCNFCIRYAQADEKSLRECLLERCEEMKSQVERVFKDYCVMRELGYDFEADSYRGSRI